MEEDEDYTKIQSSQVWLRCQMGKKCLACHL